MVFAETLSMIVFLHIDKPGGEFVLCCYKAFYSPFLPVQVRTLSTPILGILEFPEIIFFSFEQANVGFSIPGPKLAWAFDKYISTDVRKKQNKTNPTKPKPNLCCLTVVSPLISDYGL